MKPRAGQYHPKGFGAKGEGFGFRVLGLGFWV